MNALQFKMFFIFTGKTYGLKIKEYGEPIVKRWLNERKGEKKVAAHLATTNSDTQQVSALLIYQAPACSTDLLTALLLLYRT